MTYTEADEACLGDRLVALANLRFQLVMGEHEGIVDYYAQAAVNCGLTRSTVIRYIERSRQPLYNQAYRDQLVSATRAYLSGSTSAEDYQALIGATDIARLSTH